MSLSSDATILLLTIGVLLIYIELNRPGTILPGTLGLMAVLLSLANLRRFPLDLPAVALCFSAIVLFSLDLYRATPIIVAIAATLALTLGFCRLVITPPIHTVTADACGLLLGAGTSFLTRIARRARTNKRTVQGPERLD